MRRATLGQCVHGAGRLSGQGSSFSRAHIWVTRTILRCHTGRALLVVFTRCPESLTCITDIHADHCHGKIKSDKHCHESVSNTGSNS